MARTGALSRIFFLLLLASGGAYAQVTSTFDTDGDSWTALNGSVGDPQYFSTGGNPGGRIQVQDGGSGVATYFVAPAKFLGNRINSYNLRLRFDLTRSAGAAASADDGDLQLIGSTLSLFSNLPSIPSVSPSWTSYAIRLDESQNWRVGSMTGPAATAAEIASALSSLTAMRINGEYVTGAGDTGSLDNVVLEVGAPVITSFTPEEGAPGATVVITGSGFAPVTNLNTVRFNGVNAVVTAATATTITVVVPTGATSGRVEVTVGSETTLSDDVFCVPATPPSSFGLMAYYPFSGNANDASGNGNSGAVTNALLSVDPFGNANSAYRFNGTNSLLYA